MCYVNYPVSSVKDLHEDSLNNSISKNNLAKGWPNFQTTVVKMQREFSKVLQGETKQFKIFRDFLVK